MTHPSPLPFSQETEKEGTGEGHLLHTFATLI